jgi:hypothetical protein
VEPDQEWTQLRPLAEAGDVASILQQIKAVPDDAARISLYRATIRHLAFDEWRNKNLDVMTALADSVVEDCELLGADYLQQANVICFNTSANLADCWGDDFPREPRHFEKGIEYAKKALWFREHLGKGPGALAMATWALGKHQQSLGLNVEATDTFRECLALERQAADEADKPAEISPKAPDGFLIAAGYLALMERDSETLTKLAAVLDEMISRGGEEKVDGEIILRQLVLTAANMGTGFP